MADPTKSNLSHLKSRQLKQLVDRKETESSILEDITKLLIARETEEPETGKFPITTYKKLVDHKNTTPFILNMIGNQNLNEHGGIRDTELASRILRNAKTPSDILDLYTASDTGMNESNIKYLAGNPNIDEKTQNFILSKDFESPKEKLAQNPAISSDTQSELIKLNSIPIKKSLVANPNISIEDINTILDDDDPGVVSEAKKQTTKLINNDTYTTKDFKAVLNQASPELLKILIESKKEFPVEFIESVCKSAQDQIQKKDPEGKPVLTPKKNKQYLDVLREFAKNTEFPKNPQYDDTYVSLLENNIDPENIIATNLFDNKTIMNNKEAADLKEFLILEVSDSPGNYSTAIRKKVGLEGDTEEEKGEEVTAPAKEEATEPTKEEIIAPTKEEKEEPTKKEEEEEPTKEEATEPVKKSKETPNLVAKTVNNFTTFQQLLDNKDQIQKLLDSDPDFENELNDRGYGNLLYLAAHDKNYKLLAQLLDNVNLDSDKYPKALNRNVDLILKDKNNTPEVLFNLLKHFDTLGDDKLPTKIAKTSNNAKVKSLANNIVNLLKIANEDEDRALDLATDLSNKDFNTYDPNFTLTGPPPAFEEETTPKHKKVPTPTAKEKSTPAPKKAPVTKKTPAPKKTPVTENIQTTPESTEISTDSPKQPGGSSTKQDKKITKLIKKDKDTPDYAIPSIGNIATLYENILNNFLSKQNSNTYLKNLDKYIADKNLYSLLSNYAEYLGYAVTKIYGGKVAMHFDRPYVDKGSYGMGFSLPAGTYEVTKGLKEPTSHTFANPGEGIIINENLQKINTAISSLATTYKDQVNITELNNVLSFLKKARTIYTDRYKKLEEGETVTRTPRSGGVKNSGITATMANQAVKDISTDTEKLYTAESSALNNIKNALATIDTYRNLGSLKNDLASNDNKNIRKQLYVPLARIGKDNNSNSITIAKAINIYEDLSKKVQIAVDSGELSEDIADVFVYKFKSWYNRTIDYAQRWITQASYLIKLNNDLAQNPDTLMTSVLSKKDNDNLTEQIAKMQQSPYIEDTSSLELPTPTENTSIEDEEFPDIATDLEDFNFDEIENMNPTELEDLATEDNIKVGLPPQEAEKVAEEQVKVYEDLSEAHEKLKEIPQGSIDPKEFNVIHNTLQKLYDKINKLETKLATKSNKESEMMTILKELQQVSLKSADRQGIELDKIITPKLKLEEVWTSWSPTKATAFDEFINEFVEVTNEKFRKQANTDSSAAYRHYEKTDYGIKEFYYYSIYKIEPMGNTGMAFHVKYKTRKDEIIKVINSFAKGNKLFIGKMPHFIEDNDIPDTDINWITGEVVIPESLLFKLMRKTFHKSWSGAPTVHKDVSFAKTFNRINQEVLDLVNKDIQKNKGFLKKTFTSAKPITFEVLKKYKEDNPKKYKALMKKLLTVAGQVLFAKGNALIVEDS